MKQTGDKSSDKASSLIFIDGLDLFAYASLEDLAIDTVEVPGALHTLG